MFQADPGPVTVTVEVPNMLSISAPLWLLSTPPLLIASAPGPKMPMPVKPAAVTVEPAPETIMLAPTKRSRPVCSLPPLITESVPPSTATPMESPLTVSEPPLIVTPPEKQLHRSRSPPMVPILPPLLAPVSVRVPLPSVSNEPAPANLPENVVVLLPAMNRSVEGLEGPMETVPPPEAPSASEPISAATTPSPIASVAPASTLKPWVNAEIVDDIAVDREGRGVADGERVGRRC